MVVEVTRIHIYINALGSVPTQYFLLFKYLIPTLFSFFFLSVFHSIFFPPSFPFFPFVLLTSPFFLLFYFFLPFFIFFIFSLIVFSPPFLFTSFLLGMSDQPFESPATFGHERTYCTATQKTYLELCYLIISTH